MSGFVDATKRKEILDRFHDHRRRFDAAAARHSASRGGTVLAFKPAPLRNIGQRLTARELEVLELMADGLLNREIGERLFLSEETVKSHVARLLGKMQARSRTHAVALGFRRSVIQ